MTGYSDELRRGLDIAGRRRPCMMPLTGSIGLDSLSNSVHVFIVRLKGQDTCFDHCQAMLNERELQRASQFYCEHLRRTFTLSHGCRRALLGLHLGVPPPDIEFGYGARSKPFIAKPVTDLRFNQSDSGDLVAFAFTAGCEIGIDIEEVRPVSDLENVVANVFTPREIVELCRIDPSLQQEAFFAIWTRKEAYVKALGDGLFIPTDSFRVTVCPGAQAPHVFFDQHPETVRDWQLHSFHPAAGYLGTIAYRGLRRSMHIWPVVEASILLSLEVAGRAMSDLR
jgi:4'-phosphopantetheinyl transferase